jgi:hypothetical protein
MSIVVNPITSLLKPGTAFRSLDWSVMYLDVPPVIFSSVSDDPQLVTSSNLPETLSQILPDILVFSNTDIVISSTVTDQKFNQLGHTLNNSKIIVYDNITRSSSNYSKIGRVWLEKNKTSTATIAKLSVAVNIAKPRPVRVDRTLHKKNRRLPSSEATISKNKHESNSEFLKITSKESLPNRNYSVACVIAFHGRHSILEITVDLLSKQSLVPAVVLVASNPSDAQFADTLSKKYSNVFITFYQNYPLGAKWAAGVRYAKSLDVAGVLILGSDDIISSDYVNYCFSCIGRGKGSSSGYSDCVGTRTWYMYECRTDDMYSLQYAKNISIFLGAGRMFSKYFLDSIRWDIFKLDLSSGLDSYGYTQVQDFSGKFKEVSSPHSVISIKGKWEMLNSSMKILKSKNIVSKKLTQSDKKSILGDINILENLRYVI